MNDFDAVMAQAREKIRRIEELCSVAGADFDAVSRAAQVCATDLIALSDRYPEDWWPRLQRVAAKRTEERRQEWSASVDRVFLRTVEAGDGPGDAVGGGVDAVRSRVPAPLLPFLDSWEPRRDGGIVLWGKTETGKTQAALALAWRLHRSANRDVPNDWEAEVKTPVKWVQANTLARARDTFKLGTARPDIEVMSERASVLVLDDLLFGGHRLDVVLEVVAQRLNRGLPTITTTGFTPDQLRAKLGDAGVRRLLRVGSESGRMIEVARAT